MKNKFIFIILLCVGSITISNLSTEQVGLETSFSIEENLMKSLDFNYETLDNGYLIQNGNTFSSIQYDDFGNVISAIALINDTNDKLIETNLTYDENQNISQIVSNNQNLSFERDENGFLTVKQNDKLMSSNVVDDNQIIQQFANETSITRTNLNSNDYSIKYGSFNEFHINVDDNGMPNKITNLDTNTATIYTYDENENLISMINDNGQISNFNNEVINNMFGSKLVTKVKDNYIEILINEDQQHVIEDVSNGDNVSLTFNNKEISSISTNNLISGYNHYSDIIGNNESYCFNNLGYITNISDNKNILKDYKYDDLGKLIYSFDSNNNHLTKYEYDNAGNLLKENKDGEVTYYKYENKENLNQLTNINDDLLTYDEFGNLISYSNKTFEWDAGSILKQTIVNNSIVNYQYGVDKMRTSKTVNNNTTYYDYFNGYLMSSNNGKGTVKYFYDDENSVLGFHFDDSIYLYVKDPIGVIRGIVDENLDPVVLYEYDDRGVPIIKYCKSNDVLEANLILYKDYVFDYETDLYYIGTRYYSPNIRRFISQDDFEKTSKAGSNDYNFNLYSYCNNNPIMFHDKLGYEAITLSIAALAVLVIAVIILVLAVSYIVTQIYEVVSDAFKRYNSNLPTLLNKTKNDFYSLIEKFKKEALLAFGEYLITIWMWRVDNGKRENHHIIAQTSQKCARSRRLLTVTYKYDINDEINTIYLKYRLHKHLHNDTYYYAVDNYTYLGHQLGGEVLFVAHLGAIWLALFKLNESLIF